MKAYCYYVCAHMSQCAATKSWVYPDQQTNYYFATSNNFVLPLNFTIETWFKPYTTANSWGGFLSWAVGSGSESANCFCLGTVGTEAATDLFPEANAWYHFIMTWDGVKSKVG